MIPPSAAPSSLITLKHRSNAPSNATILRRSSLPRVSEMRSSSVSLRITSRSARLSISRPTPVGLDMIADCTSNGFVALSAVSSCMVWYRT